MVGKLLKHEFKETYLEILIVNGAMIILAAFNGLIFNPKSSASMVIFSLLFIALCFLYLGALIILIINIVRSFHKKLFSDEGYLTHTLPVTIDQLLISKIIVNLIWVIVTYLSIIISFIVLGAIIIDEQAFDYIFEIYNHVDPLSIFLVLISILFGLILALVSLAFVLACLNTGKIKKYKLLVGFLMFYGINIVISWIIRIINIIPYQVVFDDRIHIIRTPKSYWGFFIPIGFDTVLLDFNSILWHSIFIVTLYLLSRYLIKHKLELE